MKTIDDYKAYIDHELPAQQASLIEAEIDASAEARKEIEFLRLLGAEIRAGATQPDVAGLESTLDALAAAKPVRKTGLRGLPAKLGLALAACLVLFLVLPAVLSPSRFARTMSEAGATGGGGEPVASQGVAAFKDQDDFAPRRADDERNLNGRMQAKASTEEAPTDATGGRPERAPAAPAPEFDRPLMIRTGQLSLIVKDVVSAQEQAIKIVSGLGGMEQNTGSSRTQTGLGTANLTLRVPEARFSEAMRQLKALGEFESENKTGEDVTAQVADVEARLKVLKAEEEQYVTLLRATRKIGEILEVKERLSQVRQEIESLAAQSKALRRQASYSTIELTLREKPTVDKPAPPENWTEDTWTNAKRMLAEFGRFLGQAGIYLLVLSPIWLPIAIYIWLKSRRAKQ